MSTGSSGTESGRVASGQTLWLGGATVDARAAADSPAGAVSENGLPGFDEAYVMPGFVTLQHAANALASGGAVHARERPFQIGDDISNVFEADADPNESIGNADRRALGRCQL